MPALVTGSPVGSLITQEETYVEGAPYIFFQDYRATPLNNPDSDGYYWGMSGTSTYGSYQIGCVQDVSFAENVTMNDIRCDTVGNKGTIQKRNYIEVTLTITSLFPLTALRHMLKLSAPTTGTDKETVGIGSINNDQFYMVYAPKVYNETTADWLLFHLHKCQFVDAWSINMRYGEPWQTTGIKLRAYYDDTKPAGQAFGVIKRFDGDLT